MQKKDPDIIDAEYITIGEERIPISIPTSGTEGASTLAKRPKVSEVLNSSLSVHDLPEWRDGQSPVK